MKKTITRFAPSPTGFLHVGGLRTALYNYLYAKKTGGELILRVEDTDRERYVEGALESLVKTLETVGIEYDHGPFIQSERLHLYQEHAKKLVDQGDAYYCFCSKERLSEVRKQQQLAKMSTKYDRTCLNLTEDEVQKRLEAGEGHVIRLHVPEGETTFEDEVRGLITISNQEVDDQVIVKSDGFPTYHLAVVVDDNEMEVTHVIRGEEWLSSTPKHVILYKMFGFDLPIFAHLPLILNPDKSKLSKRQGDVAVEDYLGKGYLPAALLNFVALLGWNPTADQEIYPIETLVESFDLKKVNKGGAVFNLEKLDWMNGQYIRKMSDHDLAEVVRPFVEKTDYEVDQVLLEKICAVEKERMVKLPDVIESMKTYLERPEYDGELLVWKKSDKDDAKKQLEGVLGFVSDLADDEFESVDKIEKTIKGYIEKNGLQNGNVLWPMRVALSGQKESAGPFELAFVLGKGEVVERLGVAVKK